MRLLKRRRLWGERDNPRTRMFRSNALFSGRLIQNNFRGLYIECQLKLALSPDWQQTSDWADCDMVHADGTKLEIKQSAVVQSWSKPGKTLRPNTRYSIEASSGSWREGDQWIEDYSRKAGIYVFAYHPIMEIEVADHTDEAQWEYYVVASRDLPDGQKTIGISGIRDLATAQKYWGIDAEVDSIRLSLRSMKQ